MNRPAVICLTPVKNEAWILERFLKCASIWADHIIVADQGSDDGSREIARSFPKVAIVENPSPTFNEPERQKILLEAARRISGQRLLVALDADEFLTANFLTSPEWNTVLQAPAGTVIRFRMPVILSDLCSYWMYSPEMPWGFVDDGSNHNGKEIHSPRIPIPPQAPAVSLKEVKVMHYAYADLQRVKSRLRWYQCWELLNNTQRKLTELYRFYHKHLDIPSPQIKPIPKEWLLGYEQQGIDMTSVFSESDYRWDKEVLQLFCDYGHTKFKRLAIWEVNWSKLYERIYPDKPRVDFHDPRSRFDKYVHQWLARMQPYYTEFAPSQPRHLRLISRFVDGLLRWFGW